MINDVRKRTQYVVIYHHGQVFINSAALIDVFTVLDIRSESYCCIYATRVN